MFPLPWPLVALSVAVYAAVGLAIGAATGWIISQRRLALERKIRIDAMLGSLGFVAGFVGCVLIPWPQNTVVEQLPGGGTVATTMSRYQHPELVAILTALLLPLLYELSRLRKRHATALRRDR
jgi:hypothetical protein